MINYGVIVGRFQVNSLHAGHLELFRQVSEKHDRVIVFIGVPRTIPTKRNPLDFETRKKMIQADYPDFIILPLRDEKSDQHWSDKLDDSIGSVTMFTGSITLYGGRDSFVPHYHGFHQVHQLDIPSPVSGTEIRNKLTNRVMQSPDFRAGAIYAVSNQFDKVLGTVDAAILYRRADNGIKILFGRKPGEQFYRFPGGFVNRGETYETAVKREAYEETNLDINSLRYVESFVVDDWRYKNDPDAKITTALFVGWANSMAGRAGDDLEHINWINFEDLPESEPNSGAKFVEDAHLPLLAALKKFIQREYNGTQSSTSNRLV
jgi:bifunctional NMN adenylyltransferase/nudix hydrolase